MQLDELIDLGVKLHGSPTNLAKRVGVPPTHLHNMKAGTRACPIHVKARLYQAAGLDWKTPVLQEVADKMGKPVTAGVLATLSFGSFAAARLATDLGSAIMYIGFSRRANRA